VLGLLLGVVLYLFKGVQGAETLHDFATPSVQREEPGPGETFSQYAGQVRPALRQSAFVLCGDWYTADDIVQETLMILHRRWHVVERSAGRAGYAHVIMRHLLAHEHRCLWKAREQVCDPLPEPAADADEMDHAVDRLVLQRALAELPARQRTVVVLHYWLGLDTGEVARMLSSPPGTVRSQLARALASLRVVLREDTPVDPASSPARFPRRPQLGRGDGREILKLRQGAR
jgi:RNA polymerase sigma factor (sigma-70 family)